ncbi:MAG: YgfZ/GcvT domain-containing protein [Rhodanobacteraceae bacterium]
MRCITLLPDLPMPPVPIAPVSCIVIEGVDARRFAQMQFAGDVRALSPGHWQWNAWLDAQGRVAALMHLADPGDGRLLVVLRGGDAASVRNGLARYLLRAQACLTTRTLIAYADAALTSGRTETDGMECLLGYGERSLRLGLGQTDAPPVTANPATSNSWRLADIRAGWPTLPSGEAGFLPPALGLERLGAISFDKGCYPGQEIAARLHYRGGHKLRLHHLHGSTSLPLGTIREAGASGSIDVLDSVRSDFGTESLVVAHRTDSNRINILSNTYDVISAFSA